MLLVLAVHVHTALRAVAHRLRPEPGQTSAEYALVLLGAATVAFLFIEWANGSGRVADLFDRMFDSVIEKVS